MYITNDLQVALIAQKYGVDRIWIDLETKGKEERQKGRNSVKSQHKVEDIANISPLLFSSDMLVRINPWDDNSEAEIDSVIEAGADIIMLPMWKTIDEVKYFIKAVNGRCRTVLLLETIEAEMCLEKVLMLPGIDEIFIGMNDLHIAYGLTYMFELLSNGKVEEICNKIRSSGISFGFGGVGLMGSGLLPRPEKIILEHYRLGSGSVILSRSFCDTNKIKQLNEIEEIFRTGLDNMRRYEKSAMNVDDYVYRENIKSITNDINIRIRQIQYKQEDDLSVYIANNMNKTR